MSVPEIQVYDLQAVALEFVAVLVAFFAIRWYTDPVSTDIPLSTNHVH